MENEFYNLTHRQKEIWYMEKLYPNTSIGVIGGIFRMKGITDFSLFSDAINNFIKDNDAMRFRLLEVEGEAKQYVSEFKPCDIEFMDFSNKPIEEFYAWEQEQTLKPMELIDTPLFRFVMIKFSEDEGGFYIKIHHTISDAWSMTILVNEIAENYFTLKNGTYKDKDKPSYISYIKKEEEYKNTERCKKDKIYWMKKYEEEPEISRLKERTTKNISTKAKRRTFVLPDKLCKKIYEYSKENKISVFSMYMTALSIYINRIRGKNKINVGTIILNRADKAEKNTMGMFVTTAPVLLNIDNNDNFMNFSKNVTKEMMSLMRHQSYPFDVLQEEVREKFKMDEGLYDIILSYQNAKFLDKVANDYKTRWSFCGYQTNSLTIHINDRDNDNKLIVDYDYLTDLFYDKEIEFIHKHIEAVLWHGLDNPIKPMKNLNMVSEKEREKILYAFNDTLMDYPKDQNINELFEKCAKNNPNNIAITFENKNITYKELLKKVNQFANYLRKEGIKPNDVVAILMDHSIDMIISLLAVLKAGGCYLGISSTYPLERIKYMLSDSNAKKILVNEKYQKLLKDININTLIYEEIEYSNEDESIKNINSSEDIMYLIYTSGSTGRPKGVVIEHRNAVNYVYAFYREFKIEKSDVFLQQASYCFDAFVEEVYPTLLNGSRLVIAGQDKVRDIRELSNIIVNEDVTYISCTPLLINELDKYLPENKIKVCISGGDVLKTEYVQNFIKYSKVYNTYGPTEATVCVTYYQYNGKLKKNIPIGKPIGNYKAYILDKFLNIVPIGVPGELYVSGNGVARGYLNAPELNAQKFIKSPFDENERLYKSGDLARWYPNGDIEYLGRVDSQVKIRGYRIELEEIEKYLVGIKGVRSSAAIVKEDENGRKIICAYYTANKTFSPLELKEKLLLNLPSYMIPACFIKLEEMPLNTSGKLDKIKLPDPKKEDFVAMEYVEPRNDIDKRLVDIWAKILNVTKLGIKDDLFDFGCDSLSIIRFQTEIFNFNWQLNVQDIYENPTIEQLSNKISSCLIKSNTTSQEIVVDANVRSAGALNISNILLLGATGYLGSHILNDIINSSDYSIYCIVRAKTKELAIKRLKDKLNFYFGNKFDNLLGNRINVINGDVSEDKFGLKLNDYNEIGDKVDTIINCMGLTKHYGEYDKFEKANVISVKELIKFSKEFNVVLNHISTISVSGEFLAEDFDNEKIFSENDLYIGQKYNDNVYIKSKFEAEKMIFNEIKLGLRARIFRVGNISCRFSDGHFQENIADNAFYNRIKAFIQMKSISESICNLTFDISPVDECSLAIVKLLDYPLEKQTTFHIFNPNLIRIRSIVETMKNMDTEINIISDNEFERTMQQLLRDETKKYSLYGLIPDMKNNKLEYSSKIKTVCEITVAALKSKGFLWSKIDERYLEKMLKYMCDIGYINLK